MDIFLLECIFSTFWHLFVDISSLRNDFILKGTPFPGGNVNTAMSFPHRKNTFPQHRLNKCNSTQRKIILPTHPLPDNILSLPRSPCKIRLRPAFTLQDIMNPLGNVKRQINLSTKMLWNKIQHLLKFGIDINYL